MEQAMLIRTSLFSDSVRYDYALNRRYELIHYLDDSPSRQIMCPPNMLIEYLQEFDGFIKQFLKRGKIRCLVWLRTFLCLLEPVISRNSTPGVRANVSQRQVRQHCNPGNLLLQHHGVHVAILV